MRVQEEDVTMHDVILPYLRKDLIESGSIQSLLDEGLSQLRDLRGQSISSRISLACKVGQCTAAKKHARRSGC